MALSLPHWTRRLGLVLVLVALAAGLNLALSDHADAQDVNLDPALVAQGENLYAACVLCHGPAGQGLQNDTPAQGPSLIGVGTASVDFMVRTGRMPAVSAYDPLIKREPQYDQTDRAALGAYVTQLTLDAMEAQDERREEAQSAGEDFTEVPITLGPGIPQVGGVEDADLTRGLELFTSNCAACHGPTAAGIAVGQNDVSSNLEGVEPVVIAEAIRVGPGVMPVFGEDLIPQDDLDALVAWTDDVTTRSSPGGIAVGRGGPVSEGLVAWVVGIGLLGAVIYLLGEREGTTDPVADVPAGGAPGPEAGRSDASRSGSDKARSQEPALHGADPDEPDPDEPDAGTSDSRAPDPGGSDTDEPPPDASAPDEPGHDQGADRG